MREGRALGTWLGGRVLIVVGHPMKWGDKQTTFYAVKNAGLVVIQRSSLRITRAFDLRGRQWFYGDLCPGEWESCLRGTDEANTRKERGPLVAFGVERAWEAA
ncbi:MAG: hypothetical protein AB7T06_43625 [Kofleriaceae bacterium]